MRWKLFEEKEVLWIKASLGWTGDGWERPKRIQNSETAWRELEWEKRKKKQSKTRIPTLWALIPAWPLSSYAFLESLPPFRGQLPTMGSGVRRCPVCLLAWGFMTPSGSWEAPGIRRAGPLGVKGRTDVLQPQASYSPGVSRTCFKPSSAGSQHHAKPEPGRVRTWESSSQPRWHFLLLPTDRPQYAGILSHPGTLWYRI